jgi:PAS domain S-box-containing protein
MPRTIYIQGAMTTKYFVISMIFLAILVGVVFYLALGRLVLRRINHIAKYVNGIGKAGDSNSYLFVKGNDELSGLARDINNTVQVMEQSRESLKRQQEAEERLRLTIESVADGILVLDMGNKIISLNDASVKLHGYSRKDELIGKSLFDTLNPNELQTAKDAQQRALQMEEHINVEHTIIRKDGTLLPIEVTVAPLRDSESKIVGFVGSERDISARKMAESDLRLLLDSFGSGALLIDPDTHTIVYANETAAKLCGGRKNDFVGHVCHKYVCPAEVGKCPVTDLGQTVNVSERMLLCDPGKELPILKTVNQITYQGRKYLFETFIDITENKKTEAAFQQQKDLIDRILATTPNAMAAIGKELDLMMANKAFRDMFKYDGEGKTISEVVPSEDLQKLIASVQSGSLSKLNGEFRHNVDNHERVFEATAVKMWQDETLLVITDVTEERFRQERFFLTERLASVGEMAAGVAHELNNPLTSVIGLSQLLVEEDLDKGIKEDLDAIYSEARRAGNIVKNLLTFARKHAPERQLVDLHNVVGDVLKLRAYEHKVNNIGVETVFDPDVPLVVADYYQLQQVFFNLVINAEQAMVQSHGRGKLTVSAHRVNGSLRISFSDDGPGIQPQNLKRIFDPFFTTKEVGKGTGLGLSICYGIVTSHGGKIYAESEYGKGANFIVELPVQSN